MGKALIEEDERSIMANVGSMHSAKSKDAFML